MAYIICTLIAVCIFAILYWIGDEPAKDIYGGYYDHEVDYYYKWDD